MQRIEQAAEYARANGLTFVRDYNGFTMVQAPHESGLSIFRRGRCLESCLPSIGAALDWIEDNGGVWPNYL